MKWLNFEGEKNQVLEYLKNSLFLTKTLKSPSNSNEQRKIIHHFDQDFLHQVIVLGRCYRGSRLSMMLAVSLPVPVWQQSLGGQQHMATHGPIPPSLSSDWSYLSGCQVSLPDIYIELAFAVMTNECQRLELTYQSKCFSDL